MDAEKGAKQEIKNEEKKLVTKKEDKEHEKERKEKHKIIQMSKISLALDRYNDIFSDFDPRDYSQKSLSQDFLEEAERAFRDKGSGKFFLNFLMPASDRKMSEEVVIKKRLREFFKKRVKLFEEQLKGIVRRGIYFIIFGIILMFIATYILISYPEASLITSFLVVFLEPGGWFFFWEGLGQIIFEAKKMRPKLETYKKMSKAEITFMSYK